MRLSLGATLIYFPTEILLAVHTETTSIAPQIFGAAAGVFVIAGLWTPVSASLAALDQIWIVWSYPVSQRGDEWIHILLGVLCASVAMLGPGAWSIDARLFGRRRLPATQTRDREGPSKG